MVPNWLGAPLERDSIFFFFFVLDMTLGPFIQSRRNCIISFCNPNRLYPKARGMVMIKGCPISFLNQLLCEAYYYTIDSLNLLKMRSSIRRKKMVHLSTVACGLQLIS